MSSDEAGWPLRLRHALEAIAECRQFVAGMSYEPFRTDARTAKAVVWNISTIGEAVRHLPSVIVDAHREIPWAQMRAMRNEIVQGYDSIDYEIVWNVVQDELPPLAPLLQRVLDEA
jgi:uncharacterized protein with HEPN domain